MAELRGNLEVGDVGWRHRGEFFHSHSLSWGARISRLLEVNNLVSASLTVLSVIAATAVVSPCGNLFFFFPFFPHHCSRLFFPFFFSLSRTFVRATQRIGWLNRPARYVRLVSDTSDEAFFVGFFPRHITAYMIQLAAYSASRQQRAGRRSPKRGHFSSCSDKGSLHEDKLFWSSAFPQIVVGLFHVYRYSGSGN
jgi:hypothetical protein